MFNSKVASVAQIAASGNTQITVPVPNPTIGTEIRVSVQYAAVAATSGVSVTAQTSVDGTTFNAFGIGSQVAAAAAGKVGSVDFVIPNNNNPGGTGPLTSVKLTLTNTDATNAVSVTVESQPI